MAKRTVEQVIYADKIWQKYNQEPRWIRTTLLANCQNSLKKQDKRKT